MEENFTRNTSVYFEVIVNDNLWVIGDDERTLDTFITLYIIEAKGQHKTIIIITSFSIFYATQIVMVYLLHLFKAYEDKHEVVNDIITWDIKNLEQKFILFHVEKRSAVSLKKVSYLPFFFVFEKNKAVIWVLRTDTFQLSRD